MIRKVGFCVFVGVMIELVGIVVLFVVCMFIVVYWLFDMVMDLLMWL